MNPRERAGAASGQAGKPASTLANGGHPGKNKKTDSPNLPLKPLKPISVLRYSGKTPFQKARKYIISVRGFVKVISPQNPLKPPLLLLPYSAGAQAQSNKDAPSAEKTQDVGRRVEASSPEVLGGCGFKATPTPASIPFTPAPATEYRDLCEQHASLTAYLERERAAMLAQDEGATVAELEKLSGAMLDRMSELGALGAHLLGSAGAGGKV